MDSIVPKFYREYGLYANQFRALPHITDGLKPIERRMLLSAYEVAHDKLVKSVKIDAHCTGNYSPHGSGYGTLVQLAQRGFLYKQGNFGCNVGINEEEPAAMRYTEAMLSPYIKKLFFEYVDYVPWEKLELEKEPLYLPTIFPGCLIGNDNSIYVQGIGFGYKTFIPCYRVHDLFERLKFLLKLRDEIIISPITDCTILSKKKILQELLETGMGSLNVKGKCRYDKHKQEAHLTSWPTNTKFKSILKKLKLELDSKDIGFTDLSTDKTHVVFEVLKQRNRIQIFENIIPKIEDAITGHIHFNSVLIDVDKRPRTVSIDSMLITTFKYYSKATEDSLRASENKLAAQIEEYKLLELIRPSLVKHLDSRIKNDPEKIIKAINNDTKIETEIINFILNKYRIKKLLDFNLDVGEIQKQIEEIQKNLKDLNGYILNKIQELIGG